MTEQNGQYLQDDDFKYVMLDVGNIYLGARYTFGELMEHEMVPFKMKAILTHYILKEASKETSLESQFYYMEKGSFLFETFRQLKTKVKVYVQVEKKGIFGRKKMQYVEKIFSLKDFTEMNLTQKKACGIVICEIIISKLGMMTFSV